MTTMTDINAKMLERVRALLSKADSTEFPAEADSFRAKADQLMTDFAISQWQVDSAQSGTNQRAKPERRDFDFSWWYKSEHNSPLWSMFLSVAEHCRCVVANRGRRYGQMPVIGLASDLDYFDMLFTHLMLQMGRQLEPKPDAAKSLAENAYILRRAGLNRYRVVELMYNARINPETLMFPELRKGNEDYPTYSDLPPNRVKSLRGKFRVAADKYAADNGLDRSTSVHPKVWQRSFAHGFVSEVGYRMRAMRKEQERPSDGPSVALAIRDIRQQAMDLYDELWPPPPPMTDEEREVMRKLPKGRTLAPLTYSRAARDAGTDAGKRANLNANPNKGVSTGRGALPR